MKFSIFDRFHPARRKQNWLDSNKVEKEGELVHLWSTPIYLFQADPTKMQWHYDLKKLIQEKSKASGKALNANWDRSDLFRWGDPCCQEFNIFLGQHLKKRLSADLSSSQLEKLKWNIHGWANCKTGDDWHWIHIHAGAELSWCYYLSTVEDGFNDLFKPEFNGNFYGGALQFLDPRGTAPYMHIPIAKSFVDSGRLFVTPTEGLLLIFPSYLQHMVAPLKTKEERISVAGNFLNLRTE